MCEGIFQKVKIDQAKFKINRDVEGFHFCVRQLEDTHKIVLELLIPKKDRSDEVRIEFERLLPEWVLENVHLDLGSAVSIVNTSSDSEDVIESILLEAMDQFEDLFSLEIGEEVNDNIYFTIRFEDQKVSIWDRVLSEESLEGFITRREDLKEASC